MKIIVNGTERNASENSLKEILEREGYNFPCGGKGLCGKCKIVAPTLAVTERDRIFLSEAELQKGVRLACDKIAEEGLTVEVSFPRKPKPKKLEECDIIAILGNQTMLVGILSDGELIDSVILENERETPLEGIEKTRAVRSAIAHEAIEFFERYGVPKAGAAYVFGTEEMLAALVGSVGRPENSEPREASAYDLPADEIVFAPGENSIDRLKNAEMTETTLTERAVRYASDVRFRSRFV